MQRANSFFCWIRMGTSHRAVACVSFLVLTCGAINPDHKQDCPVSVDMGFLLDISSAVNASDVADEKTFVKSVVSHFSISRSGTRLALVTFDGGANTVLSLADPQQGQKRVEKALDGISWSGIHVNGPGILVGLNVAVQSLTRDGQGCRAHLPRILVIITHWREIKLIDGVVESISTGGMVVFAFGMGYADQNTQQGHSASRLRVHKFPHNPQLGALASTITEEICSVVRKPSAILSGFKVNTALRSHELSVLEVADDMSCALDCLHHPKCFSFNFMMATKLCELSDSTKEDSPEDVVQEEGYVYYGLRFN